MENFIFLNITALHRNINALHRNITALHRLFILIDHQSVIGPSEVRATVEQT